MEDMKVTNVFRNITPALFVMVFGLFGAYFVYGTYVDGMSSTVTTATLTSSVADIEPAAGMMDVVEDEVKTEIEFETYDPFVADLPQPASHQTIPTYTDIDMGE